MSLKVANELNKITQFRANYSTGYILKETNNKHTLETFYPNFEELSSNVIALDLQTLITEDLRYLQLDCKGLQITIEKV